MQFWGTKGFFNSYVAKTKDPLNTEDLNMWINIFNELNKIHQYEALEVEKETVSILIFSELIHQLGTNHNLWNSGEPDKWLYNSRKHSLPVLRGEACIALYNLFFIL